MVSTDFGWSRCRGAVVEGRAGLGGKDWQDELYKDVRHGRGNPMFIPIIRLSAINIRTISHSLTLIL